VCVCVSSFDNTWLLKAYAFLTSTHVDQGNVEPLDEFPYS